MKYEKIISLKNGKRCLLRNAFESDAQTVIDIFNLTHGETDYLLSYPDESILNIEEEGQFLKEKADSENEVQILALVDDMVVGMAGISALGRIYKLRHRADLGVSVAKEFWSLGIGKALMEACIECARKAGYVQLELTVVAENERAVSMYKRAGFVEYGRNPKGFNSRISGFQEVIHMRLEL
ncbi:putative acetyltransferase YhhY [Clostridium sp. N3C]|uniref:GNAT family N-acetyltransferase n=1 Tax=Clostridium sp. N3C TaxID=1776758 RepID=UPI00092E1890|nr:GNAT family N-acetyltransferase [Clostridium sp. N3C]SCN25481.1 putative acetyltransferase YhhY [Clostridium sp. N3C]